jgi:hypothetical protein
MHAKAIATVALVAGIFLTNPSARAQTVAAVEQVMVGVSVQTKQLDIALTNLSEISKSLHGTDAEGANAIANAGRQFSGAVGEATPVGVILRHMKNREDVRFTRAMLAISASKALLAADSDVEIINRSLAQIVDPAAVAESTQVRDSIVLTRNLLETFALTAKAPPRQASNLREPLYSRDMTSRP